MNSKFWIGDVCFNSRAHFIGELSFNPYLKLNRELIETKKHMLLASRGKQYLTALDTLLANDFDKKIMDMSVYDIKGITENLYQMLRVLQETSNILELYTVIESSGGTYTIDDVYGTIVNIQINGNITVVARLWSLLNGFKSPHNNHREYKIKVITVCYILARLYNALRNFEYDKHDYSILHLTEQGYIKYIFEAVDTLELIALMMKIIECIMSFVLSRITESGFYDCDGITDMLNYLRRTFTSPSCAETGVVVKDTMVYGLFDINNSTVVEL